MAKPPPLVAAPPGDNPIDRALGALAARDADRALRAAAGALKSDLASPLALLATGMALAALGQGADARAALELAADRAADGGNLPVALAALAELHARGEDEDVRVAAVTNAYGRGSPRLRAGAAAPPPAPREVAELPATLSGAALLAEAQGALEYARASLEADRSARGDAPQVPAHSLFSLFSAAALRALVESVTLRLAATGETVVAEGTPGSDLFVVARGEVEVVRAADPPGAAPLLLARLGAGAIFGEMAVLSRAPRAASVVADRPTLLLVLPLAELGGIASRSPEVGKVLAAFAQKRMVANLVRTSALLRPLSAQERQALIERFAPRTFDQGATLIQQGREADGLHLVASGQVAVVRREGGEDIVIARLDVGEVVGEVSLVFRRPSNASVVAEHPTLTLHLPRSRFLEIVREHPTLLAQLYALAVERDEETMGIASSDATDADDLVI